MKNEPKTMESVVARWFSLDDENWMRHANPISVLTRFTVMPLIALGIWSRVWLGWWCLAPIALSLLWMYFNPQAFPPPKSTKNWASRAVFGERVLLNRKKIPLPSHHKGAIHNLLNGLAGLGFIPMVYGLVYLNAIYVAGGILLMYLGKIWYLDRMVWLYMDMKDEHEEYSKWDY